MTIDKTRALSTEHDLKLPVSFSFQTSYRLGELINDEMWSVWADEGRDEEALHQLVKEGYGIVGENIWEYFVDDIQDRLKIWVSTYLEMKLDGEPGD